MCLGKIFSLRSRKKISSLVGKQPRKVHLPFRTDVCRLGQATVASSQALDCNSIKSGVELKGSTLLACNFAFHIWMKISQTIQSLMLNIVQFIVQMK